MNKKLMIIAIFNFILIIPITFYFKYFPTIISNTITNVIIFVLISSFIISLIYATTIIGKDNKDYLFILPQSSILIFLLSSIPNLRLEYPIIHDPYFYLVTTLNILNYGTLNPILTSWYSTINQQLHWPILELLTTNLVLMSNINPIQFMKFLMPTIAVITFLIIFVLVKTVSKDNRISMLAALISSVSSSLIFYNSEYHPQAFAVLIFIFIIYFFYKFKNLNNRIFGLLMLLALLVFAMSHHFSSLFIGTFALIYIVTVFIITKIKFLDTKFLNFVADVKNYNFWILIAVAMISYHIFVYFGFIAGIIDQATSLNPELSLVTIGGAVPLYVTITNSTKWIVFILAIPAIYYSYKNRNIKEFQFAILFLCFIFAGIIGSTILNIPTDRIIIFYYPFAAFFASITLFKLFDKVKRKRKLLRISLIGLISIVLLAAVFSSQSPAYFFKNTEINTYYWSSNDLSSANNLEIPGSWIKDYTNSSKEYATEFDTRSLTFYYGDIGKVYYYQKGIPDTFHGYVVVNPSIPYAYINFNKTDYLNNINTFYNDGEIIVGGTKN